MAELYGFTKDPDHAVLLMKAGVPLIQYRNKEQNHSQVVDSVRTIMKIAVKYPASRIIVNDSLSAAMESGAHGVHLGQDDGDFNTICRDYGDKLLIGVSIDTVEEALEAEKAGAHYIGAGAVYGSQTKPEAPFMGIPLLRDICRAVSVPVSAIGGITLEKVHDVLQAGASYICVISDINDQSDPCRRIKEYQKIMERMK